MPGGFLDPETVIREFGISPGMAVADLGCGAGHIGILAARQVGENGKVTAVDIMEDKLDSIRVRAKASGLNNIETVRANLEVLGSSGLADQSQDMAILANILFQSNKKSNIIAEAARVLNPGGTLIIVEWKKGAGGFGPPDDLRTDDASMRQLAQGAGLTLKRSFSAGQFHYGLIFSKS